MFCQITRNRWHVPVQVMGTAIALVAYFLGHLHKGRAFAKNVHASFANVLMLMLAVQVVFGIYLKFHITKGFHGKIRKVAVHGHGIVGKAMPVVAWVQMLFGGITTLGFCRDDHLGQCLAHFIMGSAFIGYGILLTIIMLVGQVWLKRTGRSQEFFDSALIAAWGCVNTFTEHRWGGAWVGNDIQHTTMGVIWWCAGLTGVWLSRKRDGAPKRNFIPGFVIFITGWAMSAHPQHLPLSTMVHTVFGYSLMAAGAARIIEVAFVLKDANTISEDGEANSWQYIPPFVSPTTFIHITPLTLIVALRIRVPLHGSNRRTNGAHLGRRHHARLLRPSTLQLRLPALPISQHATPSLRRQLVTICPTQGYGEIRAVTASEWTYCGDGFETD
jgi:hypothetical protein